MLIIGLTGGIGSGKSTVARLFAELGTPVIDADVVGRELVEPGSPALARIRQAFGEDVIDPSGRLDRSRLRQLVFQDADKRQELEAILHPLILGEMRRRAAALDAPYCLLVIPLLLETGQTAMVHRILVVDSTETLQIARTQARDGLSPAEASAIIGAQVDRPTRLAAADDVIVNDSDLASLREQVLHLHRRYLRLASQPDG